MRGAQEGARPGRGTRPRLGGEGEVWLLEDAGVVQFGPGAWWAS